MDTFIFEVQLKNSKNTVTLSEKGSTVSAAETALKSKHKIAKVLSRRREVPLKQAEPA